MTNSAPAWRSLTPAQRSLATNHPHVFYWVAAVEAVGFAALGAVLMLRSVAGGVVVVVVGLVVALITAVPAHWSQKHPELARQGVAAQTARRRRMARAHPLYFTVALPLFVAVQAALRWNSGRREHSVLSWTIPAVLAAGFGLVVGGVLVRRARQSGGDRSTGAA